MSREIEALNAILKHNNVEESHFCLLAKFDGQWQLIIADIHSDEVLRQTVLTANEFAPPMLNNLKMSSPEGSKEFDDQLEKARKIAKADEFQPDHIYVKRYDN